MRARTKEGYLDLVLLGVLWGSIGVLVRDMRVGSATIAALRTGIGCVAVVAFLAARGRLADLRLRDRKLLLVADGLILGLHWALMFEAFKRLSIAAAILLVFVGPVLVAFGARPLLGEPVERRTIGALALALAGMSLIAVPAWEVQDPAGVLYALGSAVAFAALMIAGKALTRSYRPQTILAWQLGVAAAFLALPATFSATDGLLDAMPRLALLGVVHTAFAGFVYFRAMTVVKAQHVGVLTYLEPASAIVYAWLVVHETPTPATIAGGALIAVGGLWIVLAGGPPSGTPEGPVAPPAGLPASLRP